MSLDPCQKCGLPLDLCICDKIAQEEQTSIKIHLERRKWGKFVTIISGIDGKNIDMLKLTKKLKGKLATGGTAKDGLIVLQGDHAFPVRDLLVREGFEEGQIELITGSR